MTNNTFECTECHKIKLCHDPDEIIEGVNPDGLNYWDGTKGKVCNNCWHELLMVREDLKPCIFDEGIGCLPQKMKQLRKFEKEKLGY